MLNLDFAYSDGNVPSKMDNILKQNRYMSTWSKFREVQSEIPEIFTKLNSFRGPAPKILIVLFRYKPSLLIVLSAK